MTLTDHEGFAYAGYAESLHYLPKELSILSNADESGCRPVYLSSNCLISWLRHAVVIITHTLKELNNEKRFSNLA
jgi:hypothetical protein